METHVLREVTGYRERFPRKRKKEIVSTDVKGIVSTEVKERVSTDVKRIVSTEVKE